MSNPNNQLVPRDSNMYNDFLYYNFFLHNFTNANIPANYQENREQSLISEVSKWQVAILKFSVPMTSIPMLKFLDNELPITDPEYKSQYDIGFSYGKNNTNILNSNLKYIPRNKATYPSGSLHHFVYYYSQILESLNSALADLWTQFFASGAAEYIALKAGLVVTNPPYVTLDDTTSYFKFHLPVGDAAPFKFIFRDSDKQDDCINILMSPKLFILFAGFPVYEYFGANLLDGKYSQSLLLHARQEDIETFTEQLDITLTATPTLTSYVPQSYVVVYQDYSNLYLWQNVRRLLFLTDIPLYAEVFNVQTNAGQSYSQTILTDFDIPSERAGNQRDILFYYADFPRYANFASRGELKKMNVNIHFQTSDLEIYPVQLLPDEEFLVKLQFRRRKIREDYEY